MQCCGAGLVWGAMVISLLIIGRTVSELVTAQRSPLSLLIAGAVAVVVGLAGILLRRPLRNLIVRAQAKSFGPAIGEKMEATKPWAIAVAGAIFIGIGAVGLIFSLIQLSTSAP